MFAKDLKLFLAVLRKASNNFRANLSRPSIINRDDNNNNNDGIGSRRVGSGYKERIDSM